MFNLWKPGPNNQKAKEVKTAVDCILREHIPTSSVQPRLCSQATVWQECFLYSFTLLHHDDPLTPLISLNFINLPDYKHQYLCFCRLLNPSMRRRKKTNCCVLWKPTHLRQRPPKARTVWVFKVNCVCLYVRVLHIVPADEAHNRHTKLAKHLRVSCSLTNRGQTFMPLSKTYV